jgi:hypothetical protein
VPKHIWEVQYAGMTLDDTRDEGDQWILGQYGQDLLKDGWEPFAVTNMSVYYPSPDPEVAKDQYSERMWFRRRKSA